MRVYFNVMHHVGRSSRVYQTFAPGVLALALVALQLVMRQAYRTRRSKREWIWERHRTVAIVFGSFAARGAHVEKSGVRHVLH